MEAQNRWKSIWDNKALVSSNYTGDEFQRFRELKKANGFDVAVANEDTYFQSFYNGWLEFYSIVVEMAGENSSFYEVGCGSGVNLFMFKNRMKGITFGGCDYSAAMVKSANISSGCGDFLCCSADEISITPKYDIVMSEPVLRIRGLC